jgi:hypothetical protein
MTLPLLLIAALGGSPAFAPVTVPFVSAAPLVAAQDSPDPPACSAVAQWMNDTQMNVSRGGAQPLTLFSAVGRGRCSTFILFSAAYFDDNGNVVCSGTVDQRVTHEQHTSYANLELRPGNIYEFMRWVNGPRTTSQQWARLICMTADGQAEIQPAELERARSLRLQAVVLPANSGLATAELRMILHP